MLLQTVINQLDILSTVFGGYEEIVKFIPKSQLNYLGAFPGDFLVVAPWLIFEEPTDLTQIGFSANKKISIYNQNWDFLYSRICDGFFGSHQLDRDLIFNSYHGEYFHLTFESEGSRKVVLLWVAKTFDSRSKQRILNIYRQQELSKFSRTTFNEFQLDSTQLSSSFPVYIYYLQGSWNDILTPEQIKNNYKTQKLTFDINDSNPLIYFQPLSNYWYCFEQNTNILSLSTPTGKGQDSWKDTGYLSYFLQSSSVNNSRFRLSSNSLLSNNASYNNSFVQLYSELRIPDKNLLAPYSLNTTIKSTAPVISYLGFNCNCSRSSTSGSVLSISISSINSQALKASVNSSFIVRPPVELMITADSSLLESAVSIILSVDP